MMDFNLHDEEGKIVQATKVQANFGNKQVSMIKE